MPEGHDTIIEVSNIMSFVFYTQILKQSVLKPASPGITLNTNKIISFSTVLAPTGQDDDDNKLYINGFYSGGRHVTFSGQEMTYFNWLPGEPKSTGTSPYIRFDDKENTLWETSNGALDRYFICEK